MSIEDLAAFGYVTDSQIKFVILVTAAEVTIKDQDVKTV